MWGCPMNERIILQWNIVDASRHLARIATDIAFDFSTSTLDMPRGWRRGIAYQRASHYWFAYRSQGGAVVVRCTGKVPDV